MPNEEENQLSTRSQRSLRDLISTERVKEQVGRCLPRHLTTDRFLRVAMTALMRTPKLMECDEASFMKCLLDLSSYGLEPDGRRAHLIPFRNNKLNITECTLIIDWKGLAELALRSGLISRLHADVVCENDEFAFDLGEVLHHKIDFKKERGEVYAAYALAQTKDGPTFTAVMTKDEIEGIRRRSRSGTNGPWVTDWREMAKKTAFRRLSKWLPLSAEFRDAVEREDDADPIPRDVGPKVTAGPTFLPKDTLPTLPARTQAAQDEPEASSAPQDSAPVAEGAPESTSVQSGAPAEDPLVLLKEVCEEEAIRPAEVAAFLHSKGQIASAGLKWKDFPKEAVQYALDNKQELLASLGGGR